MEEKQEAGAKIIEHAKTQRAIKDDYRKVFLGTPEGKRVLTDLLQYCGVHRVAHVNGDPEASARNAGRQDVGILLLDVVDSRGYDAIVELERHGAELTKIGEEF